MVMTRCPAATETGTVQDRTGRSFKCTVQAPHRAMPQPYFVPVKPSCSRRAHSRGMSGSTSRSWVSPFPPMGPDREGTLCRLPSRDGSALHGSFSCAWRCPRHDPAALGRLPLLAPRGGPIVASECVQKLMPICRSTPSRSPSARPPSRGRSVRYLRDAPHGHRRESSAVPHGVSLTPAAAVNRMGQTRPAARRRTLGVRRHGEPRATRRPLRRTASGGTPSTAVGLMRMVLEGLQSPRYNHLWCARAREEAPRRSVGRGVAGDDVSRRRALALPARQRALPVSARRHSVPAGASSRMRHPWRPRPAPRAVRRHISIAALLGRPEGVSGAATRPPSLCSRDATGLTGPALAQR
jgi:hypothetical protein